MIDKNFGEREREEVENIKEILPSPIPDIELPAMEEPARPAIVPTRDGNETKTERKDGQAEITDIDRRAEISMILRNNLREKLEKLEHGKRQEIIGSGRALRDRLYDEIPRDTFKDAELVEVIYEWLSKFGFSDAYTINEARNRAELIRELYND